MRQVRQKAVEGPPVPIAFVHSKTARSCFHNVYLPVVGTRPFHPVHWPRATLTRVPGFGSGIFHSLDSAGSSTFVILRTSHVSRYRKKPPCRSFGTLSAKPRSGEVVAADDAPVELRREIEEESARRKVSSVQLLFCGDCDGFCRGHDQADRDQDPDPRLRVHRLTQKPDVGRKLPQGSPRSLSGRFTCDRCASQARSAPTSTTLGTPTNSTCLSAARYRRLQGLSRTSEGCCAGATATAARHARESSTRAAEPRGGHGGRTGNHRSVPHRLDRPAVTRSAALSSPSSLHSMARLRRTAPVKQRLEGAPTLLDLMRSAPQPGSLTGRRRADSLVQVSAFPRIHRHALHD